MNTFGLIAIRISRCIYNNSKKSYLTINSSRLNKIQAELSIINQPRILRNYSNASSSNSRAVTYDDVVSYKNKPQVMLIDVREPQELLDTGVLPCSINIPMGSLVDALQNSSPEQFKAKYGRDYPSKNTELVFSCKMGVRAGKAMDAAIQLGYSNSKFYEGSWQDWASRQKL